ncbi:DNA methyltransferase [Spiroplasma endosymbiont of Polydrusus pterygomalis]
MIKKHSKENDIILDPFMGSGATAYACEQLNRKWLGCEINNNYFAII